MRAKKRVPLTERLARGDRLLMDGATGSEIQRRGGDVLKGSTPEWLGAWSATANVDSPDIVRSVHEDYLRVGAELLISNSFWTNRLRLEPVGLGDRWEEYARAAGRIAVEARDAVKPDAYVLGGMAPPCVEKPDWKVSDAGVIGDRALFDLFAAEAEVLKEAGVDAILPEYVGHIQDSVVAVEASATTGLPVLLAIRHVTNEATMQYGEKIADLASALRGKPVAGVLLMCSQPDAVTATLPELRRSFDGPVGVYPNVGYIPLAPLRGKTVKEGINTLGVSAADFAARARTWIEMGAQIVGGCCGTGPEHIAALKPVVKS